MFEIERKFLLKNDDWRQDQTLTVNTIKQGYLCDNENFATRIRIQGSKAYMTVKSVKVLHDTMRIEYEFPVNLSHAEYIFENYDVQFIKKDRYKVNYQGKIWEIDVFHGELEGLTIAEVELQNVDEKVLFPKWIGEEVTTDPRYYNLYLSQHGRPNQKKHAPQETGGEV